MEIAYKYIPLLMFIFTVSCAQRNEADIFISQVYVEDFQTENMNDCKPSDVDLSNDEAEQFFLRSKKVEYKIIHDHYNVAPCYLEGILKVKNKSCDWKIQASAVGSITCGGELDYYVCDSCDDLFGWAEK